MTTPIERSEPPPEQKLPEPKMKRLYALVLSFLAFEIAVFYALTRWLS